MFAGAVICISGRKSLGMAVWATDSADLAAAGVPLANGLSDELPAEATVRMPSEVAASTAADRSSSNGCP